MVIQSVIDWTLTTNADDDAHRIQVTRTRVTQNSISRIYRIRADRTCSTHAVCNYYNKMHIFIRHAGINWRWLQRLSSVHRIPCDKLNILWQSASKLCKHAQSNLLIYGTNSFNSIWAFGTLIAKMQHKVHLSCYACEQSSFHFNYFRTWNSIWCDNHDAGELTSEMCSKRRHWIADARIFFSALFCFILPTRWLINFLLCIVPWFQSTFGTHFVVFTRLNIQDQMILERECRQCSTEKGVMSCIVHVDRYCNDNILKPHTIFAQGK